MTANHYILKYLRTAKLCLYCWQYLIAMKSLSWLQNFDIGVVYKDWGCFFERVETPLDTVLGLQGHQPCLTFLLCLTLPTLVEVCHCGTEWLELVGWSLIEDLVLNNFYYVSHQQGHNLQKLCLTLSNFFQPSQTFTTLLCFFLLWCRWASVGHCFNNLFRGAFLPVCMSVYWSMVCLFLDI